MSLRTREDLRTALTSRFDKIATDKAVHTCDNQAISDLIYPIGQLERDKSQQSEKNKRDKIFENIGQVASEDLAAFIGSTIAPAGQRWLKLTLENPTDAADKENMRILDGVSRKLLHFLAAPEQKFHLCLDESLIHNVVYGLGIPHVQERGNNLIFTSIANDEVYLQENNDDYPDVIFRLRRMTAKQILQEYVLIDENLQSHDLELEDIKELEDKAESDPTYLYELIYGVVPKTDSLAVMSGKSKDFEYVTLHLFRDSVGNKSGILRLSGVDYQQYFPYRFRRGSNQPYGIGCGHRAIADVRTLQVFKKSNIASALLAERPPFDVPWQTYAKNKLNLSPGAMNHRRRTSRGGNEKAEPLLLVGNVLISVEMADRVRETVRNAFYLDKVAESKRGEMSATESNIRARDRIQSMTPNITRIISEFVTPAIEATLRFMFNKKMFDEEFTKEMLNDISIIYITYALRAQMDSDLLGFQSLTQSVQSLGQVFPTLRYQLQEKEVMPMLVDKYFLDHKLIKPAQQAQAELEQDQVRANADAAKSQSEAFFNTARAASELGIR